MCSVFTQIDLVEDEIFSQKLKTMKAMKASSLFNRTFLTIYLWLELIVWSFLAYSAIFHGKIFDYEFTDTVEFVDAINAGENWYYQLMFDQLNLTNIELVDQRIVQGKNAFSVSFRLLNQSNDIRFTTEIDGDFCLVWTDQLNQLFNFLP